MKVKKVLFSALLCLASAAHAQAKPYTVVGGYKVDAQTMTGFRAWPAAACDRCHGPNQEALCGPPLVNSPRTAAQDDLSPTPPQRRPQQGPPRLRPGSRETSSIR